MKLLNPEIQNLETLKIVDPTFKIEENLKIVNLKMKTLSNEETLKSVKPYFLTLFHKLF